MCLNGVAAARRHGELGVLWRPAAQRGAYSHDGPIRRMNHGFILTMGQSDALSSPAAQRGVRTAAHPPAVPRDSLRCKVYGSSARAFAKLTTRSLET